MPQQQRGKSKRARNAAFAARTKAAGFVTDVPAAPSPNQNSPLPPLNTTLFTNAGPRFLLDDKASKRILRTQSRVKALIPSTTRHGEGTYGYVTSAELHLKGDLHDKSEYKTIGALKVSKLPAAQLLSEGLDGSFLRELAIYARIQGAGNLAKGIFVKMTPTEQFLVMEHYLSNLEDVYDKIFAAAAPMSMPELVELTRAVMFQVATGIKELHDLKILHKDLKPANILVADDGRVLITDYGLSAHLVTGIRTPQAFYFRPSTATIEPPEAAVDTGPLGQQYDIWALGCCLDFFILGRYDFDFYTAGQHWRYRTGLADYQQRNARALASFDRRGLTGEPIQDLLSHLLAVDPRGRPDIDLVLGHPFFAGMTVRGAMETVKRFIGSATTERTLKLLRNTRRRGNAGATEDPEPAAYVLIQPEEYGFEPYAPTTGFSYKWFFTFYEWLFSVTMDPYKGMQYRVPLYSYYQAIELFERLLTIRKGVIIRTEFQDYLTILLGIASRMGPIEQSGGGSIALRHVAHYSASQKPPSELLAIEMTVVEDFNGDLYPQPGGLVEQVVRATASIQPYNTAHRFTILFNLVYSCWNHVDGNLEGCIELAQLYFAKHEGAVALADPVPRHLGSIHRNVCDRLVELMGGAATPSFEHLDILFLSDAMSKGFDSARVRQILEIPAAVRYGRRVSTIKMIEKLSRVEALVHDMPRLDPAGGAGAGAGP